MNTMARDESGRVHLKVTDPIFRRSGRWTSSSGSSLVASWCGASISFLFSGSLLHVCAGAKTERRDIENGGTSMLACTISNVQSGARDTRTYDVLPSTELVLSNATDLIVADAPVLVELTLIDWASVLELEEIIFDSEASVQRSPAPAARILVIGDSISVGYSDGSQPVPHGCLDAFPFIARQNLYNRSHIDIAVDLIAFPGWMLTAPTAHEAEEGTPSGMSQKYFHVSPWDSDEHDVGKDEHPSIIFIAMGTNDEFINISEERFVDATCAFTSRLVSIYGDTLKNVCIIHPFIDFADPPMSELAAAYPRVLHNLRTRCAPEISFHAFAIGNILPQHHTMDGIHPTVTGHALVAAEAEKQLLPLLLDDPDLQMGRKM